MVTTTPYSALRTGVALKGSFFGARGSSCSCDPCDCNPCNCGDALLPNLPRWRVSGCIIDEGIVGGVDLARLVVLSLALPYGAKEEAAWEEILLLDSRATPEQVQALLTVFDETLESMPAEIASYARTRRAVYRVPITYISDEQRPLLRVNAVPEQLLLVRADESQGPFELPEWSYDGPMALRESLDLRF